MRQTEKRERRNQCGTNFQNGNLTGQVNQAGGDINVTSKLNQTITDDHNQTIGQVYGGMVVYVSGGQAVINPPDTEKTSAEAIPTEIGSNPYKGLQAFHENDHKKFFGRSIQIKTLWEQFRTLYERDHSIRLFPIYDPSGSGKSSLARAGLIPELAENPLPGLVRARMAVLNPETEPLQGDLTVRKDIDEVAKEAYRTCEKYGRR